MEFSKKFKSLQFLMVQGSLNPNITFLGEKVYIFPYITLVFFLFQATGHSFSPRNVIFGLNIVPQENEDFF